MPLPPPHNGYAFPGLDNLHNDIYPAIAASSNSSLQQSGKVVLITGAGRGIGRATALQYAHASVGCIILCARTSSQLDQVESEIHEVNGKIRVLKYTVDVTEDEEVQKVAQDIKEKEGKLHVLVNNAGASSAWVPIVDTEPAKWWRDFEVNIKGPYLFLHACLPLLVETAEKSKTTVDVINVGSIGGHTTAPGSSAYGSSKFALLRLTEFVDVEYASKGVNVVTVHPGGVETTLSKQELDILQAYLIDTPELAGGFFVWLTAAARTWLGGRYVAATWDVDVLQSMKTDIVNGDKLKVKMVV
ncbi:putative oxidoreductase ucpA [Dothidotthia symphoricarpi CBS 119687]|uniref:Putative oxidoreductase ucpA n=1 Tax=Dothidotthia symphoricarpi CBS 119687 TaxID=1392245 RepID=A0A6A6A9P7_9PLEO|nr:putative oxidoreductase ucpA [Dothidotthia symphoricarpi CBS 119687]KAF2128286.1 putative oxidoreductase ucpA [Dothidotthia symphoricarpi CBS 119687]